MSEIEPLANLSVKALLRSHVAIAEELRRRDILRSANNPTGDLAEYLFCRAFGWHQEDNSKAGYDAIHKGIRYQIKGRRLHNKNRSRQLSALRNFETKPFDVLAPIFFNHQYDVIKAALIPYHVVAKHVTFVAHSNSQRFVLRDLIFDDPDVEIVTEKLQAVTFE